MGIKTNALEGGNLEYVAAVKTMCAIITDRIFSALHSALYPLTPNYYKERKALKILHNYTNSVIDKRKASHIMDNEVNETDSFGIKKRQAFLDLLLTYKIDGQSLSRNDIREEVDTFMFEVR